MATLTSSVNTDFTPAVGDFIVQVSGGTASITRRNTSGAANVSIGTLTNGAGVVSNPIAGAIYQFVPQGSTVVAVQADQ